MSPQPLYFIHITDTHIGPTPDYEWEGQQPLPCVEKMVQVIGDMPASPDFIIHTGDVVSAPSPEAYKLAAQTFAPLQPPIYYVTGNHDHPTDIQTYLPMSEIELLAPNNEALFYRFFCKGWEFLVLDAYAEDLPDYNGKMPAFQLLYLQKTIQKPGPPLIIFTHFPILPLNSPWFDETMLDLNGEAVHQTLVGNPRLRAVFHGHIHQPMQTMRDGVLYVSGGSVFTQFAAWPDNENMRSDPAHDPAYSFVHLLPDQLIIHQHTFPRPAERP